MLLSVANAQRFLRGIPGKARVEADSRSKAEEALRQGPPHLNAWASVPSRGASPEKGSSGEAEPLPEPPRPRELEHPWLVARRRRL